MGLLSALKVWTVSYAAEAAYAEKCGKIRWQKQVCTRDAPKRFFDENCHTRGGRRVSTIWVLEENAVKSA